MQFQVDTGEGKAGDVLMKNIVMKKKKLGLA